MNPERIVRIQVNGQSAADDLGVQTLIQACLRDCRRPAKMADAKQVLNVEQNQSAGPATRRQAISWRLIFCSERSTLVRSQMIPRPDRTLSAPAAEGRG